MPGTCVRLGALHAFTTQSQLSLLSKFCPKIERRRLASSLTYLQESM